MNYGIKPVYSWSVDLLLVSAVIGLGVIVGSLLFVLGYFALVFGGFL